MKIHYVNKHGRTNLPWQGAFKRLGDLSLGSIKDIVFPDEIDHLHLGGSCKGGIITEEVVKDVQARTGCSVSVFYGDAWINRFKFHHRLLDAKIPRLKVYSAALYGTRMWRDEVIWVLHPTDENIFKCVEHDEYNDTVLFCGNVNKYRSSIIDEVEKAGIKVDTVGPNGKYPGMFGTKLVEFSKKYSIGFGIPFNPKLPKVRYSSSRLANFMGMGLVYLETDFNLEGVFEKDEIIQWKGVDDLVTKIRYYRANLDEGFEIIRKGRKKIFDNWTFNKLAERFIREGNGEIYYRDEAQRA